MSAAAAVLEVLVEASGREVRLRGVINVHTVPDLRAQLQQILEGGAGDLVLHLAEAEVQDATGLGVLVGVHHRALRTGRRLVIAEASERLERLLRVTRLHLVLARLEDPASSSAARILRSVPSLPPLR